MSKSPDRKSLSLPRALVPFILLALALYLGAAYAGSVRAGEHNYSLGRLATQEEIAGWDIDIRPDGAGLPAGSGSIADGEVLFDERCAVCHGEFGEGAGRYPVLAGGIGTLSSNDPVKTVGSYWPYASTLFDYIRRAMPFGDAQSLTADETYALTAYVLYLNDLLDEDAELDQTSLPAIEMPNRDGFTEPDPRPDTPGISVEKPCMKDCKGAVSITGTARSIDVTPDD